MKARIRKIFIAALTISIIYSAQDLSAQPIEINGFAGWQFGGTAKLYYGDLRISDAVNYGGKIALGLSTTTYVELSYMRSDTNGRFSLYNSPEPPSETYYFSSNYIHVGGLQEVHMGPLAPFATIGLGMAIWDPKEGNPTSLNTKGQFSITFGAGVKIWLNDFLGIRLQGSMMMPMVYNGFGFGCGISSGGSSCGSNLYTRITPFQGEFSGGIMIKLTPN
jgi:hypothetical protein